MTKEEVLDLAIKIQGPTAQEEQAIEALASLIDVLKANQQQEGDIQPLSAAIAAALLSIRQIRVIYEIQGWTIRSIQKEKVRALAAELSVSLSQPSAAVTLSKKK